MKVESKLRGEGLLVATKDRAVDFDDRCYALGQSLGVCDHMLNRRYTKSTISQKLKVAQKNSRIKKSFSE